MSKLSNNLFNIGLGVCGVVGMVEGMPLVLREMEDTPAEMATRINSCASALGEAAIQTSRVPSECREMEFNFKSRTVTIRDYDPSEVGVEGTTVTEEVTYTLPSADDLKEKDVNYEREFNEKQKGHRAIGKLSGGSFGLAWLGVNIAAYKQDKNEKYLKKNQTP